MISSFSRASAPNFARSFRSLTSSPDMTSPLPSGPKIASSACTSWAAAAATSASAASRGVANVFGAAGVAADDLAAIPSDATASSTLSTLMRVSSWL